MSDAKKSLIVWGGWDGHEPENVAGFFRELLEAEGFSVEVSDTLDAFTSVDLTKLSLIVPVWTMGQISSDQSRAVTSAVAGGVGLAGCHGGMCDAFRGDTEWQFMTGGQWVAHPGNDGVKYSVELVRGVNDELVSGLPDSFDVESEQYYLHVDPGVKVLATTQFPAPGVEGPHTANPCAMPQVWTKMYGQGRVYYNALGHTRSVIEAEVPKELMRRGLLWAAR